MTIAEALKKYQDIEIELLLGHVIKQSKEFLFLHGEKKLTKLQDKKLQTLVVKRRKGIPIAYLLGYKYFYGLKFTVTPNVLIPRPESEWLVEEALRFVRLREKRQSPTKPMQILEVGTGSGCIAISIAKNTNPKNVSVKATDISTKSLAVAKANSRSHKTKVQFSKNNLLTGVKGKFDLIIANLPYVPINDYQKLRKNLKHEPKLALTDGTNEFILIAKLIEQAPAYLNPGGCLLLEVDPKAISLPSLKRAKVIKDIHGLKRFALLTL